MSDRMRGINIALTILLTLATPALAESQGLIEYFNDQYIPVQDITEEGANIKVVYIMGPLESPDVFGENILYIYGTVAREYPGAESVEVSCVRGVETVYVYETSTGNIRGYVNSELSDEEFKSGITVREGSRGGSLQGIDLKGNVNMLIALGGLAGLSLMIIFVIFLCFILRKRRKK